MREAWAVAIAGAAGSLFRWGVCVWTQRLTHARFPYGVLLVNVLGCFALAFLMELILLRDVLPRAWRVGLSVGFLGGFTTFSTFGHDTMRCIEEGAWAMAVLNVLGNVVLGVAAAAAGFQVARGLAAA